MDSITSRNLRYLGLYSLSRETCKPWAKSCQMHKCLAINLKSRTSWSFRPREIFPVCPRSLQKAPTWQFATLLWCKATWAGWSFCLVHSLSSEILNIKKQKKNMENQKYLYNFCTIESICTTILPNCTAYLAEKNWCRGFFLISFIHRVWMFLFCAEIWVCLQGAVPYLCGLLINTHHILFLLGPESLGEGIKML